MELIVLVEPSKGPDPGHMVIGQRSADGETKYFGFHFDPKDLPAEFQPPARWQEYLYSHKTPSHIRDDGIYVQGLLTDEGRLFFEKRAACDSAVETVVPAPAAWDKAG